MNGATACRYELDHSAIIHLASMTEQWTNTFRLCATLDRRIDRDILQESLSLVAPRFPTIVAGIQRGARGYQVVPVAQAPAVQADTDPLRPMSLDQIETCAMRVMYRDNQIAVEIFHSLTDGYGGLLFLKTLIAAYLACSGDLKWDSISDSQIPDLRQAPDASELSDDFPRYTADRAAPRNGAKVYQLPGMPDKPARVRITTAAVSVQNLKALARSYHVSLTALLVCLMGEAIQDMQRRHAANDETEELVQIMVPIDLRRKLQSETLRNFTLYAMVKVWPIREPGTMEEKMQYVQEQIVHQSSAQALRESITTNVRLEQNAVVRRLPLSVKMRLLRIGFHFFGRRNSCLSVSNLGNIALPALMERHVRSLTFCLMPRSDAPYNCGVISYQGTLYISISRRCDIPELERLFFSKLMAMGMEVQFDEDEQMKL